MAGGLGLPPFIPFPSQSVQVAAGGIAAAAFTQAAADKVWASAARVLTDKAGFTLTAGSYSVRASATQDGEVSIGNGLTQPAADASISSVTTSRAWCAPAGASLSAAAVDQQNAWGRVFLGSATTVTARRGGGAAVTTAYRFNVVELF